MATGGDLGELGFSLGVKDNVSQELNNIMKKFVNMDISVNKATDSIRKLSAKLRETNDISGEGPSKEMLKMANAVDSAATRIVRLRSEIRKTSDAISNIKSIPNFMQDKNLLASLGKLQGYLRTLGNIDGSKVLDGNRLQAIFSAGARSIQEANISLKAYKETANQSKSAIEANARAARDLASAFRQAHDAASKTSSAVNDIKSLLLQGGIVYGVQQFAMSVIQTGGQIEQQHIALQSILGDISAANTLFEQTKQLALQSPFTFGELNKDVKQLAAFGVETDKLYDKTKRIADISSGLGVSFERLGLAYGQVKARSWLDGKELRQFAYAGLPMLQKLAEMYSKEQGKTITTSNVRDMITKRQVSFEDVDKVFQQLTDAGGQFYNMQFVLSETLLGRYNKLKDAWDIMLGDFASGKSVIGGTFAFIIDQIADLIRNIHTLTPMLMSLGGAYLAKKGLDLATSKLGVSSIITQMRAVQATQLRSFALTQMQKVGEGEITMEIAKQNVTRQSTLLSQKEVQMSAYSQLAMQGQFNLLQLQELRQRGLIDEAVTSLLVKIGVLKAEEEAIVLNGTRAQAVWSMASSKISGFFTGGNIAMIGAAVGLALWQGYSQWSQRVQNGVQDMVTSARQKAKELNNNINEAKSAGVTEENVKNMQSIVEGSDLYTKSMQEQVGHAKTLQERYNVLLGVMHDIREEHERMSANSETAEEVIKASSMGNWKDIGRYGWAPGRMLASVGKAGFDFLFNDDIDKNMEQYDSSFQLYKASLGDMSGYKDEIHKALASIRKDYADTYKDIQGKPFEQQLRILSESGAWDKIIAQISKSDKSFNGLSKTYIERTDDVDRKWGEIVNDDVPKMADSLAQQYHMNLNEFQEYCKKHPEYATSMIRSIVDSLKQGSAETKNQLLNVLLNFFGLASEGVAAIKKGAPSVYDKETNVGKNLLHNLVKKHGNGVFSVKEINDIAKEGEGYTEAFQAIQNGYKKARNEYDDAKASKVGGAKLASLLKEYTRWQRLAESNGVSLDVGKNKGTGNFGKSKAKEKFDKEQQRILKGWRERKSVLEEYYETWNKWRDIVGKEKAKGIVRSDKRFASVSKDFTDPEILGANLDKLANKYAKLAKTDEQRHFITETRAQAAKREADLELESTEKSMRALTEKLDLLSKQYDLYQKLAKVMGSDSAAHYAFGSNHLGLAGNWSYYGYLKDYLNSINGKPNIKPFVNGSPNDKSPSATIYAKAISGVDFSKYGGLDNVLKMSDADISGTFGGKGNLSKLLIDFKKEIDKLDDKIADTLTKGFGYFDDYKAQIDEINKSYDEQIERLEKRNKLNEDNDKYISNEALRRGKIVLAQQKARDISNINLEAQKHSKDYYNFFGAITALKVEDAEKYGDTIRDLVNKAFQSGAIDAREYSKQIRQIDEQMDKLHNQHSDFLTYLQGGLDAVVQKHKASGDDLQMRGMTEGEAARKGYQAAEVSGDINGMAKYLNDIQLADKMKANGEAMSNTAGKLKGTISVIDTIVNGINNAVQSMKKFVDQIADDFDTLGKGGNGIRDSKGYQFVSGFSEASQGAADGWNNLKNGNIMGAVTGVYRSFAGWFTGSARARDAKLERQIQLSERQLKALNNLQNSIERNLKKTLGGVYSYKAEKRDIEKLKAGLDDYSLAKNGVTYGHDTRLTSKAIGTGAGIAVGAGSAALSGALLGSAVGPIGTAVGAAVGALAGFVIGGLFGHKKKKHTTIYREETNTAMEKAYRTQAYYDQQFAVMNMQLDQTDAKLEKEKEKKKKDEGKIDDYESQVAELKSNIATFAMDVAKSIYDIDLKSWAKELTNAIVDAWSKGEDAAKAYHDKARDLMKNLAVNIITQRVMENALKKTSELITAKMQAKSGLLDENDILNIADEVDRAGSDAIENITKILDALKVKGLDLSQNGSSSIGSGIKSITEETADILASYVNSIRLDVSVDRVNIQKIADAMALMPQMSDIANSQLAELRIISINTQKNAENTERILTLFRDITTPGLKKVNIH